MAQFLLNFRIPTNPKKARYANKQDTSFRTHHAYDSGLNHNIFSYRKVSAFNGLLCLSLRLINFLDLSNSVFRLNSVVLASAVSHDDFDLF